MVEASPCQQWARPWAGWEAGPAEARLYSQRPPRLLSRATVPVLGTPAAANFLPRSPSVPQPPTHPTLYSAPHKQGPLDVNPTPAASPSPNTPSPPPHLHFLPVTKPCGFSLPVLCLSPSPHTGPKDHLPPDLPVERGWGRRRRALLPAPVAEQTLRAGALVQLPRSPGGKMFLWPEGFQRAGSAVRPALRGPLSSYKCLKRRWSWPQIQNQWADR